MTSRSFSLRALAALALIAIPSAPGAGAQEAAAPRIDVGVDPRVELLSTVFRLAGRSEYNQPLAASPYSQEVDEAFGPFRGHAAVLAAQDLVRRRGIGYDKPMSLALHLTGLLPLEERTPFEPLPTSLGTHWTTADARAFVVELQGFVDETGFAEFVKDHAPLYAGSTARLEEAVASRPFLEWFDSFFGGKPGARFRVVAGMLNGPASYGARVVFPDGREEITPVIGVEQWDAEGLPVFGESFEELLVHEFCHSYTNPVVARHAEVLREPAERLLEHRRKTMQRQAYGAWEALMNETWVRACVGRYVLQANGEEALETYLAHHHGRGFDWTRHITEELAGYEADRERYSDIDAFVPRVAAALTAFADELDERAARAPRVLSMSPENGARDVDPALTELRVEFDRPMRDRSWSVCGSGADFPELSEPAYDAERRVFTARVRLQPGTTYRFSLNNELHKSFASASGAPLEPVYVSFTTRDG